MGTCSLGYKKQATGFKTSCIATGMYTYSQKCERERYFIDTINGHDEHIHILMLLKHDNSIAKQMQLLKGESSYWVNRNNIIRGGLDWADKYFAASVSDDKIEIVRAYISNQQQHHKKISFSTEYSHFLKKLGYQEDFG